MAEQLRHIEFPTLESAGTIIGYQFRSTVVARAKEIGSKLNFTEQEDLTRRLIEYTSWHASKGLSFLSDIARSAKIEFATAALMEIPEVMEKDNLISSDHCSGRFEVGQNGVAIIHNEDDIDYAGLNVEEVVYRFYLKKDNLAIVGVAYPGDLLTNSFFMRSDGLAMGFYHIESNAYLRDPGRLGLPRYFFLNNLLTVPSLKGGLKLAVETKHLAGGAVVLADKQEVVCVEFSGDATHVQKIQNDGFHTNQFQWLPDSHHKFVTASSRLRSQALHHHSGLHLTEGETINLFSAEPIYREATWATIVARPSQGVIYVRGRQPGEFVRQNLSPLNYNEDDETATDLV